MLLIPSKASREGGGFCVPRAISKALLIGRITKFFISLLVARFARCLILRNRNIGKIKTRIIIKRTKAFITLLVARLLIELKLGNQIWIII